MAKSVTCSCSPNVGYKKEPLNANGDGVIVVLNPRGTLCVVS